MRDVHFPQAAKCIRGVVILLLLLQSACSVQKPRLQVASLTPADRAIAQDIEQRLKDDANSIGSIRALLKVRAQKATFVQDVSAAYVYSQPGFSRLSLFATQFNRLVGLLIADAQYIHVLLPDERLLLFGTADASSMKEALAVALRPVELAAWLCGTLPLPEKGEKRTVFVDTNEHYFITEQLLPEGRLLRAKVRRDADGAIRVTAIELLSIDEQEPLLYSLVHWQKNGAYPSSLATEVSQEALSLLIDVTRMEVSSEALSQAESQKVFAVPNPAGVRRQPLSTEGGEPSLFSVR